MGKVAGDHSGPLGPTSLLKQRFKQWPAAQKAPRLKASLLPWVGALVASRDMSWIPAGTTSAGEGESSHLATEPRAAAVTRSMPDWVVVSDNY